MKFILDTNVWIDICRGRLSCDQFTNSHKGRGIEYAWAPPVLIELFVGIAANEDRNFARNRLMFQTTESLQAEILELPTPFMWKLLWNISGRSPSRVTPVHYRTLVEMLLRTTSYDAFLRQTQLPDSVWKQTVNAHEVHQAVLDQELSALNVLASRGASASLALACARMFRLSGLLPDPASIEIKCSAALEFLKASLDKVRNGANPKKNDRGVYGDFQMFWYLADPQIAFVSKEDFSNEIKFSPQRDRIISLTTFVETYC